MLIYSDDNDQKCNNGSLYGHSSNSVKEIVISFSEQKHCDGKEIISTFRQW